MGELTGGVSCVIEHSPGQRLFCPARCIRATLLFEAPRLDAKNNTSRSFWMKIREGGLSYRIPRASGCRSSPCRRSDRRGRDELPDRSGRHPDLFLWITSTSSAFRKPTDCRWISNHHDTPEALRSGPIREAPAVRNCSCFLKNLVIHLGYDSYFGWPTKVRVLGVVAKVLTFATNGATCWRY